MNTKTLHKISYGLYVVCSGDAKKFNGQIANTVFQITATPPTIAVSINKQNYTHEFISASKVFTASILTESSPMTFIGTFGFKCGRDINKFDNIAYKFGVTGAPIVLDNAAGYLEARVTDCLDVGTHTIFVGELVDAEMLSDEPPITYAYYHQIKQGKTPKTAATYVADDEPKKNAEKNVAVKEKKEGGKNMDKYQCSVCGYIYDPKKGDSDGGIPPGTAFEDLPDDWVCPVCGASKDQFEKMT